MNSYDLLITKLDEFIKKYYIVKLIKGILLSIGIITLVYLILSVCEFYFYLSGIARGIFLFGFLFLFLLVLGSLVIIPTLKLIRIGKLISYEQASEIIAKHFFEIKDKLINILELKRIMNNPLRDHTLIIASINQKIENIKLFPFKKAIDYRQILKYLKYSLAPVIILFCVLLVSPAVIKDSNKRIIHYKTKFEKPQPFYFELTNKDLNIKKGDNKKIIVKVIGEFIPDEVFMEISGNQIIMKRTEKKKNEFWYEFKNVYNSFNFRFTAQDISSEEHKITVLPSPSLLNFTVTVNTPKYTGESDTILYNTNDIVVPYGSILMFNFKTVDADSLFINDGEQSSSLESVNKEFTFKRLANKNLNYTLSLKNKYFKIDELSKISLTVIPDLYPSISIEQQKDTANIYIVYFRGLINDDYGFKTLNFKYRIVKKEEQETLKDEIDLSTDIPFLSAVLKQEFFYVFDFSAIKAEKDEVIEYFFEVGDNDAISGSKKARSEIMTFEMPSYEELKEFENTVNESIQDKLDRTIKLTEDLQKQIQLFKEKTIEGNTSDWENKQMLQSILDKQDLLQNLTKDLAQENKEKNKTLEMFQEKNEDLLQKQEDIQKLLDEIMTDEMKELMKKIEDLQKQFDEKMMEKLLEDQTFSYEELSERLDRTKELLKREQIEQKINNAIEELNHLSEDQKELSKEQLDKSIDKTKLSEQQKDLENRFNAIMKDYQQALELNKELKKEMKMDDFLEEQNAIKEEFENTEDNMQKGKTGKASDSQSKNSQNMKSLANKMQAGMDMNSMQQNGESIETLRRILENLIIFSFEQEDLIGKIKNITTNDPKYIELYDKQLSISDDFKVIEDSLKALAGRVPMINKAIMDELFEINTNLRESSDNLKIRNIKLTQNNQIKIMTSSNNLALLLSEIINQMKDQMQGGGSGGSSGKNKPKNGKQEAFDGLKSGQERLKKQMEEMLNQMKNGQGQFDENAQNKKLAKMLAEQEIMRHMLNEMNSDFNLSPETQKVLREINKMAEENEKDIVNKKITPELIERQKEIETRLLDAENAENKRKTEDKRESDEGKDGVYKSPEEIFKNKKKNDSFNENIYKQNLQMKIFYKKLYEKYSEKINR